MKKTFKTMLALMAGAMVFTSCDKDNIIENVNEQNPSELKPMTFTASMEGQNGATRAKIDGLDIKWMEGDKISIFDGAEENYGNQMFILTNGALTTSGTFSGSAAESSSYYALYPYAETKGESKTVTEEEAMAAAGNRSDILSEWKELWGTYPENVLDYMKFFDISPENQAIIIAFLSGEPLIIKSGILFNTGNIEGGVLPAFQTATAGSADPKAMLMIGKSTDASTLQFKNVCSYLKVTPTFACTSIVLKSNGAEGLAGTLTVGLDNNGIPTTTVTSNGTNTVTISGTIAANSTYYFAVLPTTLTSGFTIEFLNTDGNWYKKSTGKEVTLARSKVLNLGSFGTSNLTIDYTKGVATRKGSDTPVKWVQLWEDGPKFAEYNVGATSVTEYGGYYNWGMSVEHSIGNYDIYQSGTNELFGNDDTATIIWGNNWRMPTQAEFQTLLNNCTCTWTMQNGYNGLLCTGKDDYSSNSIFLPAAGQYREGSFVENPGNDGFYWSSTPSGEMSAFYLQILANYVYGRGRTNGCSVRAVLNEE